MDPEGKDSARGGDTQTPTSAKRPAKKTIFGSALAGIGAGIGSIGQTIVKPIVPRKDRTSSREEASGPDSDEEQESSQVALEASQVAEAMGAPKVAVTLASDGTLTSEGSEDLSASVDAESEDDGRSASPFSSPIMGSRHRRPASASTTPQKRSALSHPLPAC